MTKSSMDLWDVAFLGPGFLLLDQYLDSFFPEKYILYLFLVSNLLSFYHLSNCFRDKFLCFLADKTVIEV